MRVPRVQGHFHSHLYSTKAEPRQVQLCPTHFGVGSARQVPATHPHGLYPPGVLVLAQCNTLCNHSPLQLDSPICGQTVWMLESIGGLWWQREVSKGYNLVHICTPWITLQIRKGDRVYKNPSLTFYMVVSMWEPSIFLLQYMEKKLCK